MLFNSLLFLGFLPIVFGVYWVLQPKYRNVFLLVASYYFYFTYNPWLLFLLIGTSVLDFYLAKLISGTINQNKKKGYLIISLAINLGVLFAFKYSVFFYNSIAVIFHQPEFLTQIIIPLGLSFYTFQSLSYIIDVYRGDYKPDDTIVDFLLFVSFFPHMVAGPIMKHTVLMPQLKNVSFFNAINWEGFLKHSIWGFFKKMVIADNLMLLVNPAFETPKNFNSLELTLAGVLFLIQLYCDFSGYTDIATGVAKLFNINLSVNWKRPLFASSVTDYWKRHHISLSTWFKDYVYISIGGNKVKFSKWVFNIMIVFLISGLWHGANYTFIIWGFLNGVAYAIESILNRKNKINIIPKIIKWIGSITLISFFFIAFRASSVHNLIDIYKGIFVDLTVKNGISHLLNIQDKLFYPMIIAMIGLLTFKEFMEEYQIKLNNKWGNNLKTAYYLIIVLLIFIFGNFNANTFIYFQF